MQVALLFPKTELLLDEEQPPMKKTPNIFRTHVDLYHFHHQLNARMLYFEKDVRIRAEKSESLIRWKRREKAEKADLIYN